MEGNVDCYGTLSPGELSEEIINFTRAVQTYTFSLLI